MRKAEKAIITCAVTGSVHTPTMSPYLPITPDQIVDESLAAAEAGAAIVHLHARDPDNGRPVPDPEVYAQFLPRIKQDSDVIVNITTGGTSSFSFEDRMAAPLEFSPEITSFNMGPLATGTFMMLEKFKEFKYDWEEQFLAGSKSNVFSNTFENMEYIAKELGDKRGVRFEFECFDIGHLHSLRALVDMGWVKPPLFIQSVYGFLGGIGADPEHVHSMKQTADRLFGDDYYWSNLAAGKHQMKVITMGAIMGAHVRVGLEDSLWYGKGEMAKSNAEQVGRVRRILEELSIDIATPDEAREMLQTKGSSQVSF